MPRRDPCPRAPALVVLLALLAPPGMGATPTFEDATEQAGLDFLHSGYDQGQPAFIEVVGSGACWGDVDHDGLEDLYLVNQRYMNGTGNEAYDPHHALYLNEGGGRFVEAEGRGSDLRGWGTGCSFADTEGDGDLDLLVTHYGYAVLLVNDGEGSFANATAARNVSLDGKCGDDACFATGTAWADYDRDGDLDVYVANYVDWHPEFNNQGNSPGPYDGLPNVLFRNRGDGTFEDATAQAGVDDAPGPQHSKSFQPVWFDHDRDGWPDLYVASDTTRNTLFRNQRDGTFTDIAAQAGVDDPRSSMGLDIADWSLDGWPDLFMTHYEGEYGGLYRARGDGTYEDLSDQLPVELDTVGWGAGFHDFDSDGDLDLYDVNGHTHPESNWFEQQPHFFEYEAGEWEDRTAQAGPAFQNRTISRGSAVADYDHDGDLDIVQANAYNRTARLFRNDGVQAQWLQLELRQPGLNPFAVGARVEASLPDGRALHREVKAGNSFMSQDAMLVHLGLGNATSVDVRVVWPDGAEEGLRGVEAGQRLRWHRGGSVTNDTLAPRTRFALEGPEGENGWFTGPVDVALEVEERGVSWTSGVARVQVMAPGLGWEPYGAPVRVAEDGVHTLQGRASDRAGNQEPARGLAVRVDATPPVTEPRVQGTPGAGGWFVSAVHVGLEARDATSGVNGTVYRLDGGEWTNGSLVAVDGDGSHLLEFRSRDRAGNEEAVNSLVVPVDRRPPWLLLAPLNVLAPWGGEVLLWAHDATSGVGRVSFFVDGAAEPAAVLEGPHGWAWQPAPGSLAAGLHALRAVAEDRAGHASEAEGWLLVVPPP